MCLPPVLFIINYCAVIKLRWRCVKCAVTPFGTWGCRCGFGGPEILLAISHKLYIPRALTLQAKRCATDSPEDYNNHRSTNVTLALYQVRFGSFGHLRLPLWVYLRTATTAAVQKLRWRCVKCAVTPFSTRGCRCVFRGPEILVAMCQELHILHGPMIRAGRCGGDSPGD